MSSRGQRGDGHTAAHSDGHWPLQRDGNGGSLPGPGGRNAPASCCSAGSSPASVVQQLHAAERLCKELLVLPIPTRILFRALALKHGDVLTMSTFLPVSLGETGICPKREVDEQVNL